MPNRIPFPARATLALAIGAVLSAGALAQKPKPTMAADDISVSVSGSPVEFTAGGPVMQGESVLVPFRAVLEKLGSTVAYDPATKRIDAATTKYKVRLTPGSTAARVNGRDINMAVAPKLIAGTVYIPLRFVSESLGAKVQYDAAGKTVAITPGPESTGTSAGTDAHATNDANTTTDANMAGNDANATNMGGGNMAGNTDVNANNMAGNTDANATNGAMSNTPTNTDVNATNTVPTDNSAMNNAPANATNSVPTRPSSTATYAPTTATTETSEPSNIPWLPILGVLAALALAAFAYFFLKGRRSGQIIASDRDNSSK